MLGVESDAVFGGLLWQEVTLSFGIGIVLGIGIDFGLAGLTIGVPNSLHYRDSTACLCGPAWNARP